MFTSRCRPRVIMYQSWLWSCNNYIALFYLILSGPLHFGVGLECALLECEKQADRLRMSIDNSINPCEDFVQFACGKRFNALREERDSDVRFRGDLTSRALDLRKLLKHKLSEHRSEPERHRAVGLAKTFYQSCSTTTPREAQIGVRLLLNRLGAWPAVSTKWKDEHFTWVKFTKCARKMGFLPRMFLHMGLNFQNIEGPWSPNDTVQLTIEGPKFNFGIHSLNDYLNIADMIYSNKNATTVRDISEALEFAERLQRLNRNGDSISMKRIPITILQKEFPQVDWMLLVKAILARQQADYLSNKSFVYTDLKYISKVLNLLERTDKRIQANYGFLAIIEDLHLDIRPLMHMAKAKDQVTIEEICYDSLAAIFEKALDMMVAEMINSKMKKKLTEVQNDIANEARNLFQNTPWMDHQTQLRAEKKINRTRFVNAFPDNLFTDNYYNHLEFSDPEAILVVFREANALLVDHYYLQVDKPREFYAIYQRQNQTYVAIKRDFITQEITVKPEHVTNQVYIPAGVLVNGRFSILPELDFMNYAFIGFQIATAMSLHIYEKGSYIDHKLQWLDQPWWTERTQMQFANRSECQKISPLQPLEKISQVFAYIGGAEIAYKAMFEASEKKKTITSITNLPFTAKQLFWISIVAPDCNEKDKHQYNTIVSHNVNFTADFKCSPRSKMNIQSKCKMWIR